MELLRCHNMIPAHVKWYVSDGKLFASALFWGTRTQCENYIRQHDRTAKREQPDLFAAASLAAAQVAA